MRWKRPLFLFHRWAGIVLCLFFALWFLSGLFMMYVEFPQLTRAEQARGVRTLDFSSATLTSAQAIAKLQPKDFAARATPSALEPIDVDPFATQVTPSSVRLAMIFDRPAYVVRADNGAQPRTVFADTGEILASVDARQAELAAQVFASRSGLAGDVRFIEVVQTDQWTVSSALNDHRPLIRVALDDAQATELYVSSRTGEVVRDTHRRERVLNYFGAVTHWLYPTFVRKYPLVWEWMVDVLSSVGVVLAITGLWIGLLRWNRRAKPGKSAVPYRGVMRWHYFTGLAFGLVTVTWVFSGLLSMNPLSLNPSRRATTDQALLYSGKALTPNDFAMPMHLGTAAIAAELTHYLGQPFYHVVDRDLRTRLVPASERANVMPSLKAMLELAPRLLPEPIAATHVLTSYDNYYYSRHPERAERPLPIVRVVFDDADHTWFHLDPVTGKILERSTRTNRVYRWLYNGLHSWDIWWLWQRRPLWDICVVVFSLGGCALATIGVVIGWRRLRHKPRRRERVNVLGPERFEPLPTDR